MKCESKIYRERILLLDYWIAILMVLVILGHFSFSFAPAWYEKFHSWVYSFHMGAFFFVSGYLVKYTYRDLSCWNDYCRYVGKKLKKFGSPFLILGTFLSIFSIWRKGGHFEDYVSALVKLLVDPVASQVIYLWFIYVLFCFYILAPLFCQYSRIFGFSGMIAGFVLSFIPMPHLFAMHLFSKFLFFFVFGVITCQYLNRIAHFPGWLGWCVLPFFVWCSFFAGEVPYLLSGLFSLPCLYAFCHFILNKGYFRHLAELISRNCFSIYLYQMIFLNLLALLFGKLPKNNFFFSLFMFVGLCCSIGGSILIASGIDKIREYLTRGKI